MRERVNECAKFTRCVLLGRADTRSVVNFIDDLIEHRDEYDNDVLAQVQVMMEVWYAGAIKRKKADYDMRFWAMYHAHILNERIDDKITREKRGKFRYANESYSEHKRLSNSVFDSFIADVEAGKLTADMLTMLYTYKTRGWSRPENARYTVQELEEKIDAIVSDTIDMLDSSQIKQIKDAVVRIREHRD